MGKYRLKFIKYISVSCKDWTGEWLLSYRDYTSISRENILSIELVLDQTQLHQKLTIKVPPVMRMFWAFVKIPDVDC